MSLLPDLLRKLARAAHDKNEDIVDETLVRLNKWSGWQPQIVAFMARMEPRLQSYVNARITAASAVDDEYHGALPLPRHGDNGTPIGMASVTLDAASAKYVPATSSEWTTTFAVAGLPAGGPASLLLLQEAASPPIDTIGARAVTVSGAIAFNQAAAGWTRKGVKATDASVQFMKLTGADLTASSAMLIQYVTIGTNPASGYRAFNQLGTTNYEQARLVNGSKIQGASGLTPNVATGAAAHSGIEVIVTKYDRASSVLAVYSSKEFVKPTYVAQGAGASTDIYMLGDSGFATDSTLVYEVLFEGAAAEQSDANVRSLLQALGWTVLW